MNESDLVLQIIEDENLDPSMIFIYSNGILDSTDSKIVKTNKWIYRIFNIHNTIVFYNK